MKFLIILGLLSLSVTQLLGQEKIFKDSLIKKIRINATNGDTIVTFKDYENIDKLCQGPRDKKGNQVDFIVQNVNSREKIDKLINEIFTKEDIQDMKGLSFYIQFLALPSGEVQSASFLFLHGDPQVNVDKLVEFSNQLKKHTTLTVKFDRDIEQKGLVGWAFRVFPFPE